MTKREILNRILELSPGGTKTYSVFANLIREIRDDVRGEETPRRPDDDGSAPIGSFDDAVDRVQVIRDYCYKATINDTVLTVMLRVLQGDLVDADDAETDAVNEIDHGSQIVSVEIPSGYRVVVEPIGGGR